MTSSPSFEQAKALSKRTGTFFICASCPKMWEGIALGRNRCTGMACGSPVRRKDFPEYSGNIKDMSSVCLVCGGTDVVAEVKVDGGTHIMGLCMSHLEVIDDNAAPRESGIIVEDKKVLIYPKPGKAKSEYQNAQHTI